MNKLLTLIAAISLCINASAQNEKYKISLSLEEAVSTAHEQSPQALSAKFTFMQSYWQYRSYRAQFLPSLNLSATLGRYNRSLVSLQNSETGELKYITNDNMRNSLTMSVDQSIALTGGTLSLYTSLNRIDQFSPDKSIIYNSQPINITYVQPLNSYNTLKWERRSEPVKYEKAKRDYIYAMESISSNVATIFFDLIKLKLRVALGQKNYENSQKLYQITKERLALGTANRNDLIQLEVRLLKEQLALNDNKLTLDTRMVALRSYLGYNENVELDLVIPTTGPDIVLDYNDVIDRSFANSSYVIERELRVTEAQQDVARAKSSTGLQATLNAQFGLTQKGGNLSSAYNDPMNQEIVSLGLKIPIVDWGLGRGKIKIAKAREELIRTNAKQEISDYRQDIMIKVFKFNSQNTQCELSKRADSLAQERYEIIRERFTGGSTSVTELNTAQSEKDESSIRYIEDLGNFWQYYFEIRRLTLFDYINGRKLSADFESIVE